MKEECLNDYRCDCGKLLFKGSELRGKIEIKCKRCGKIRTISGKFVPLLCRDGKGAYEAERLKFSKNKSTL